MTDFGSGIDLDQDLDLTITPSGDLATADGLDELKKDLSFRLIQALESANPGRLNQDTSDRLRAVIKGLLQEDPRVDTVNRISIEPNPGSSTNLRIGVDVDTAEGPFDLVVTV